MERNGKIYCDKCDLDIEKQRHVRVPRPQIAGKNTQPYAHFHNREGYRNDCWAGVKKEAEVRAAARKPTIEDLRQYKLWDARHPKGVIA